MNEKKYLLALSTFENVYIEYTNSSIASKILRNDIQNYVEQLKKENEELIDYLTQQIKKQEYKLKTLNFGLDIIHTRSEIMTYKEILSKIEKSDKQ